MANYKIISLLRKIRTEAKLTQSELAQKINQSQSYVSKYETGEQRLDFTEIEIICDAVGISLIDLVRRYLES
jgi:transcriptional regulator with XRE-family HTH domain